MKTNLWLIIPCYNEEQILDFSMTELENMIDRLKREGLISDNSKIVLVDDGSRDDTWEKIQHKCKTTPCFTGIKLSRNRGHQNALFAGMMYACGKCDCIISLDADLQDDISVIPEFLEKFRQGYQVVYGVRSSRETDTVFKKGSASFFYKIMKLMGAETIDNHADYRLLGDRALLALQDYKETNLFLRGIVPLVGFNSTEVYYSRKERTAGETKYPLRKMISFALDGITSFSVKPLRIISLIGILCSGLSVVGLLYALISYFANVAVPGWTAIVCSIWLIGGIQLLCLGVVGEYIGKIFSEVKHRPRYIIEDIVESNARHALSDLSKNDCT